MSSDPQPPTSRARLFALPLLLFVAVTGVVVALAAAHPAQPGGGGDTATPVALGDAAKGQATFNGTCAGCHGQNGVGGGVGPKLQGLPLSLAQARATIRSGRGVMPAGLVSGTDEDDVLAYLATILAGGGGATPTATAPPATETAATATTPPPTTTEAPPVTTKAAAPVPRGTVRLDGPALSSLHVALDGDAPAAWSVWLQGPGKLRRVGTIAQGERRLAVTPSGAGSLVQGYDAVLVGPTSAAPALRAPIAAAAADALAELFVASSTAPDGSPLRAATAVQLAVLRDHVRFLKTALDEGNVFNVRFHGEHIVNIVLGKPIQDLDGNGEASNPGDGVGLLGRGGRGYLPRTTAAARSVAGGAGAAPAARAAAAAVAAAEARSTRLLGAIVANARRCARAPSASSARVAVTTVVRLDGQLATQQAAARRAGTRLPTFTLVPPTG